MCCRLAVGVAQQQLYTTYQVPGTWYEIQGATLRGWLPPPDTLAHEQDREQNANEADRGVQDLGAN